MSTQVSTSLVSNLNGVLWGQVLYDENHSLGRREYIETELPLARKNYENNKTKYQERKRGPDAHAARRAESDGFELEEVWSSD